MDKDSFGQKIKFVYECYILKNKSLPSRSFQDKFPDGVKIGSWLLANKERIKDEALKGNRQAQVIYKKIRVKSLSLEAKVNYVYDNYVFNGKNIPELNSDDKFPDGTDIGNWFFRNINTLTKLAENGSVALQRVVSAYNQDKEDDHKTPVSKVDSSVNKKNNFDYMFVRLGDYIYELKRYILNYRSLPKEDEKFSDGTSMVKFLENNREWIYLNRDENVFISDLVKLILNIDQFYFDDLDVLFELRKYKR